MTDPLSKMAKLAHFDPLNSLKEQITYPKLVPVLAERKPFLYDKQLPYCSNTTIEYWGYFGTELCSASSNWYIYDKPYPDRQSESDAESEESETELDSNEGSESESPSAPPKTEATPKVSSPLAKDPVVSDTHYYKDKIMEPGNSYFTGTHDGWPYYPGYWTYCRCDMQFNPSMEHNGDVLTDIDTMCSTHTFEMVDKQLLEYEQKMLGDHFKVKRILVMQSKKLLNTFYNNYMRLLNDSQDAIPVISTYHHVPYTPTSRNYNTMLLSGMDKSMDSHLLNVNSLIFKETPSATHRYSVTDKDGVYRMLKCQICPGNYSELPSGCLTNILYPADFNKDNGILLNYEKTGYNPDGNVTWLITNPELVYVDYVIEYTVVSKPPPEVKSFASIYIQKSEELLLQLPYELSEHPYESVHTILLESILKARTFVITCGYEITKQPIPGTYAEDPNIRKLIKAMRYHSMLLSKHELYKHYPMKKLYDAMTAESNCVEHIRAYHSNIKSNRSISKTNYTIIANIIHKLLDQSIQYYSLQAERYIAWLTPQDS